MMNRQWRSVGAVIVSFGLSMCTARDYAQELANKLDAEFTRNVPPRSTKADVIAFLRSHRIEYYELPEKSLGGRIPDAQKTFLTKSGVYMTFQFDNAGRLQSHTFRVERTGL